MVDHGTSGFEFPIGCGWVEGGGRLWCGVQPMITNSRPWHQWFRVSNKCVLEEGGGRLLCGVHTTNNNGGCNLY